MNDTQSWFERGHVALITGASHGFGRAIARRLAERGLRLVITAREPEALMLARTQLREQTFVEALAGDVAHAQHLAALIARTKHVFGRLDLLVNNASTLGRVPLPALDELEPDVLQKLFTTNVFAPLHLMQRAFPLLAASGGSIVNVSSDAAINAYPGWGGYGASKAALEHVSRTFAAEHEGTGVSVLVADPGSMDTNMHRDAEPGADFAAMATPDEIAGALLAVISRPREPYARVELPELLRVLARA
jgi:NAD(P)-dependent dehydrogenase (short-subunit alcohol dehydrogenase family)